MNNNQASNNNSPSNKTSIFFFGTSSFAATILEKIIAEKLPISLIVSQPDRPQGRKKNIKPTPVKIVAEKNKLKIFQPENFDQTTIDYLTNLKPTIFLVAAYGLILPKSILTIPSLGSFNIHGSLLPALRGASPIQTALLKGLKNTGITLIKMDQQLDHGPIVCQKKITIKKSEVYEELEQKMAKKSAQLILETIQLIISKKIELKNQDHSQATFTSIIKKQDGQINWNHSAEEIYNRWRAFHHWPKIFSFWNNKRIVFEKISFSASNEVSPKKPGTVFKNKNNQTAIQTKSGSIFPIEVKPEGKNIMSIGSFLNGNQDFIGTVLLEK